jgi:tripartite-type tricarboxylate transporter receptor subunit TctC
LRHAQAYPSKPIRVIVPFAAGGSNDVIGRALQRPLARYLNGTIVVENMPGAATKIGVMEVMKAAPDGHTLLFASLASTMAYYYSARSTT